MSRNFGQTVILMKYSPPQLLIEAHAALGEGPAWDAARGLLYWVDIHAGHLHRYDPQTTTDEIIPVPAPLGCVAPARSGALLLGLQSGLARLDPASGQLTWLTKPEAHLPGNRFNDGKCGPDGRFLTGTMDNAELATTGSLYSYSPNGTLKTLLRDVRISNGLAWSPDYQTLYYIDTPTRQITAYEYDLASGEIANPRLAVSIPPALGWPDGMTSDAQGRLWVALWGGAAITVWDPAHGKLLETIGLPAKNVTSCAFGGPHNTQLYITSARQGLSTADLSAYPATGSLFRLETNVTGLPTFSFAD